MSSGVYDPLSPGGRSALAEERSRLQQALELLGDQRTKHEAALAETVNKILGCEAAISAISRLLGDEPSVPAASSAIALDEPRTAGDSIIEAVVAVFQENQNEALHYRILTNRVLARGVTLGGKDAAGTLLSIITNARYSDRFERSARGTYRLATPSSSDAAPATAKKLRKSRRRRRAKRSA